MPTPVTKLKNTYSTSPRVLDAINAALVSHHARRIEFQYSDSGVPVGITFSMMVEGKELYYSMPARIENVQAVLKRECKTFAQRNAITYDKARQVAWANIRDFILSQLAMIDIGLVSLEEIMLPYMVVGEDDKTLFAAMKERKFIAPPTVHEGELVE